MKSATIKELRTRVSEAIDTLGSTEASAVAVLKAKGIWGKARLPRECPLAVYFNNMTASTVRVDTHKVTVPLTMWWRRQLSVRLPSHLRHLIFRVDRGEYPELLEILKEA